MSNATGKRGEEVARLLGVSLLAYDPDYLFMRADKSTFALPCDVVDALWNSQTQLVEARVLARQMSAFAIAIAPLHSHRCIFCDAEGRYSLRSESYEEIRHSPYCLLMTIKRWERES